MIHVPQNQNHLGYLVKNTQLLLSSSHSIVSKYLRPHGLQQARLSCPSLSHRAYSSSCPLNHWCHPTILPLLSPSPPASIFPSNRVFSNESSLRISWPKYWSINFSISTSNEYSALSSFRIHWFDLLAIQRTLKNLLRHVCSKVSILTIQPSLFSKSHMHT